MSQHKNLAHHFNSLEQQKDSATVGMWSFLVTEVMLFSGLFTVYAVYHYLYPSAFEAGSQTLSVPIGAFNTIILILSSFTMVLAVWAASQGKRNLILIFLALTLLFGAIFLGIKGFEYYGKWQHHLIPNSHFQFPDYPNPGHVKLFFGLYFAMTGTHAFHMIIGMGYILFLMRKTMKGAFSKEYYTPIDLAGLYWHFVDVVWIFLFPLLYLLGLHLGAH